MNEMSMYNKEARRKASEESMKRFFANEVDRWIRNAVFDMIREENETLWFIEFPDGSWLMEDRVNQTKEPQFALPFDSENMAKIFLTHYELDQKLDCKVTEHQFIKP